MPEVPEVIDITEQPDRCPKLLKPLHNVIAAIRERIFGPRITAEWVEWSVPSGTDEEETGPMVMSY